MPVDPPFFNENLPFRNEPPRTNDVAGAFEIQEVFEHAEWANQPGDTTAHAPYLRKSPLAGNPPKFVLIQIAKGDQTAPNPRTSATIRAGDLADVTAYLRNDLAFAEDPSVSKNPHAFLFRFTSPGITGEIARGGHNQLTTFLASNGATIIHPDPTRFWEVPIVELPEQLQFIPPLGEVTALGAAVGSTRTPEHTQNPPPLQLWLVKADIVCSNGLCNCPDEYANGKCETQLTDTPGILNGFPRWGMLRVHVPKQ